MQLGTNRNAAGKSVRAVCLLLVAVAEAENSEKVRGANQTEKPKTNCPQSPNQPHKPKNPSRETFGEGGGW